MDNRYRVRCQVWKGPGYGVEEIVGYTLYPEGADLPFEDLAGFEEDVSPRGKPFLTEVSAGVYDGITKAPRGGVYSDLVFYPSREERPMLAREREIPRRLS